MERAAKYIKQNSEFGKETLPFIMCGDFNALPISSVLSAFYNEDILAQGDDQSPSVWRIPEDYDEERKQKYIKINQIFKKKIQQGKMEPVIGRIKSAY